jgi:6-pyruvoyltetrahydropterin/6-carboxytetrahydropterin synthase
MPLLQITRRTYFNAAHRLHNPDKSEEWNQRVFGKCNSPHYHGHNYVMEVTVEGEPHPETGYVLDLSVLKRIIQEKILSQCDHKNLNVEVAFLQGIMPSTENILVAFWKELEPAIAAEGVRLHRIRLHETENNSAEYTGG